MFLVFPKQENGKKRKEEEKTLPSENEPDGYKKHRLSGGRKGENIEEDQ